MAAGAFPVLGDLTILGHPVSHGATPPIRTPAPELGQDKDILTSIGYTKDQIADLAKRGVI